ncbi:hypothetical protein Acr_06g0008920 [Actinidia rufa]|uniref:DOG1 domain-containing protein n=1 Tax=Actinidia rufa TaxID=165716 RepID=A0A7J0ERJ3_9ERIC|nr:hypothetical protein Acr_06g0008920 [Actinidia rufa]
MKTQVEEKFSDYFEKWVSQLEAYLRLLLTASSASPLNKSDYEALVGKLTDHHKAYYTAKWAAAHDDVLAFFSPVWLSPLENAYLWVTGWKPSTAFRLVDSVCRTSVNSHSVLTESQLKKVEELRGRIKLEEERVEREMERQQVAVADRTLVELARVATRVNRVDSEEVDGRVEGAVRGLLRGLERVMKMADCVRLKTLKGLLEVLTPMQCVGFLAAESMLQLQMRRLGKRRESNGL